MGLLSGIASSFGFTSSGDDSSQGANSDDGKSICQASTSQGSSNHNYTDSAVDANQDHGSSTTQSLNIKEENAFIENDSNNCEEQVINGDTDSLYNKLNNFLYTCVDKEAEAKRQKFFGTLFNSSPEFSPEKLEKKSTDKNQSSDVTDVMNYDIIPKAMNEEVKGLTSFQASTDIKDDGASKPPKAPKGEIQDPLLNRILMTSPWAALSVYLMRKAFRDKRNNINVLPWKARMAKFQMELTFSLGLAALVSFRLLRVGMFDPVRSKECNSMADYFKVDMQQLFIACNVPIPPALEITKEEDDES